MKTKVVGLVLMLSGLFYSEIRAAESTAVSGRQTIKLVSGDTMTGTIGVVKDGSLSLITDYGPVRVPVDKLAPETK